MAGAILPFGLVLLFCYTANMGEQRMASMSDNETLTQKDVLQLLLNASQHSVTREELTSARQELKQDISVLRIELKQDIAEVKQEISELRTELKQDISEVKTEIKSVVKTLSNLQWLIVAAVVSFYLKDSVLSWLRALAK